ncbi:undecaprenyl-diphosphatase UppP [Candidatus Microgenomates bacterium]|nr:undecaprenyl-diphosphatase UppP [Candidatus Microgenomates bacterium]
MNILQVVLLSVIEGVTEFLPISSTGHMILASQILGITETEFVKSFEIIIQLGAILAVVFLYWKILIKNTALWKSVIVAFIPTGIFGLVLYKFVKKFLLGNTSVVAWSLLIGGIIIILLEMYFKKHPGQKTFEKISPVKTFFIGITQSLSMIPGVSRAAATIFGSMGAGMDRKSAVEFSFFLAIPTMFAASALDLVKTRLLFSSADYLLIAVGFVCSFLVAAITVKYFLKYVQKHNFMAFGAYRIILGIIFILFSV